MIRYDTVVVGSGPAGATAARYLAAGGARVCLLDKARFPRSKPCGGALSPRVLRELPADVESIVHARIRRVTFTYRCRRPFPVVSSEPMAYMVCREEFDTWLRARAEEAGASVREAEAARLIEEHKTGFTVRTPAGSVTAATVIGADGANSLVAAQLFPRRRPARYLAIEAEILHDAGRLDETVLVDVGACPGGYAWAFPKGDRINLGVMVVASKGRLLRAALAEFLAGNPSLPAPASLSLKAAPVAAPQAAPITCARPGVLLVGDAAQLADPFLGEGIYHAVQSGRLAAEAILAGGDPAKAAARYAEAVENGIWPDLVAASRLALIVHRMPRWWHHLLSRMPDSLSRVAAVLDGEDTYAGLLRRVVRQVEARAGGWVRRRLRMHTGDVRRARSAPGD
jgi:geranylgeranyl reductase family protein